MTNEQRPQDDRHEMLRRIVDAEASRAAWLRFRELAAGGPAARAGPGGGRGWVSAAWTGPRMSGGPSCASTPWSLSSTKPWTTDWGWTTTAIRSAGRPKRWWASMTSRALFIIVAESIVIFGPMSQLGCRSACSGVASRIRSAGQSRKGPPDAVSTTRSTSSIDRPARQAAIAACSQGRSLMNESPQSIHLLLGGWTWLYIVPE